MNKKVRYGILVLFMFCLLVGCGNQKDTGKVPSDVENPSNNSTDNEQANIQEKVIVDKNGIKITAKSIKYNIYNVEIKLLIENNTNQNITVQTRDFSINGIMLNSSLSADVTPGKKANDSILIDDSDLETAKITTIKDIEFSLDIFDADSWDDIFEETGIKLETNATNYTQVYNTDGKLLVDQNDIKVYALKLDDEESVFGIDLMLYIENNTNQNITVQARDVSVNGFMIDASLSSDINAGKKTYDTLYFFDSDLEENDITDVSDITDLELKLVAFNSDNWDDLFRTDSIKIDFD